MVQHIGSRSPAWRLLKQPASGAPSPVAPAPPPPQYSCIVSKDFLYDMKLGLYFHDLKETDPGDFSLKSHNKFPGAFMDCIKMV